MIYDTSYSILLHVCPATIQQSIIIQIGNSFTAVVTNPYNRDMIYFIDYDDVYEWIVTGNFDFLTFEDILDVVSAVRTIVNLFHLLIRSHFK